MGNLFGFAAFGATRPSATRPVVTPENGAATPDDWAKDCSSPLLRDGTEWRAAWANFLTANLRGLVRGSGVTDNNTDDNLVARAVRSDGLNRMNAGGTANAITLTPVAPAPAFASLADLVNVPLRFTVAATNNGPATINVNSLGARPAIIPGGATMVGGELPAGSIVTAMYDGTNFQIISGSFGLRVLPSLTTFFVNATTGSDGNDGLSAGSAFATIQGAVNAIAARYIAPAGVLINVANGSYAGFNIAASLIASWTITGNTGSPASVLVSAATNSVNRGRALSITRGVIATVQGIAMSSTQENWANSGGTLTLSNINMQANVSFYSGGTYYGGYTLLIGNINFTGNGFGFAIASLGGVLSFGFSDGVGSNALTLTCSGTPVLSSGNVLASAGGTIVAYPSAATMVGAVTGTRYIANTNGVINTNGGGVNYFPGSTAGSLSTGGQYI